MIKIKIMIILIFFTIGCATAKIKDLSESSDIPRASVKGMIKSKSTHNWIAFYLISANGKRVEYEGSAHPFDSKILLNQGENSIVVLVETCNYPMDARYYRYHARGEITALLISGKNYQVNGFFDEKIYHIWIEDIETNEKASEVIHLKVTPIVDDSVRPVVNEALSGGNISSFKISCNEPYKLTQDCSNKWGPNRKININSFPIAVAANKNGNIILIGDAKRISNAIREGLIFSKNLYHSIAVNYSYDIIKHVLTKNKIKILKVKAVTSLKNIDGYILELDGDGYSILKQYSVE